MVDSKWLKNYLSEADLQTIEEAVHSGEKKTSAEIVPMVVRSSSAYNQSRMTLMLLGTLFFVLLFEVFQFETHWDATYQKIGFIAVAFIVVFLVLPRLARIDGVKRWMTIITDETEQVHKRARLEFYESCVHETNDKEGILIFISLLEHQVVVLTDKKIAAYFPPETWQKVVEEILSGIRQKQMAQGLKTAIAHLSDLLAEPFPIKSNDRNELSNKLIIKE